MGTVLVFRINLHTAERIYRVACRLCVLLRGEGRWSVDWEDCGCVLRIETKIVAQVDMIELLTKAGLAYEWRDE